MPMLPESHARAAVCRGALRLALAAAATGAALLLSAGAAEADGGLLDDQLSQAASVVSEAALAAAPVQDAARAVLAPVAPAPVQDALEPVRQTAKTVLRTATEVQAPVLPATPVPAPVLSATPVPAPVLPATPLPIPTPEPVLVPLPVPPSPVVVLLPELEVGAAQLPVAEPSDQVADAPPTGAPPTGASSGVATEPGVSGSPAATDAGGAFLSVLALLDPRADLNAAQAPSQRPEAPPGPGAPQPPLAPGSTGVSTRDGGGQDVLLPRNVADAGDLVASVLDEKAALGLLARQHEISVPPD